MLLDVINKIFMTPNMTENSFYVKLKNRGLIHIEGTDRHEFLQGLITNDINKLTPKTPLYACLLNAQGKFLHDLPTSSGIKSAQENARAAFEGLAKTYTSIVKSQHENAQPAHA